MNLITRGLACLAGSALLVTTTGSASAQSVNDAVKCFVVSSMFARVAKEEKGKQAAMQAKLFYLGRLTGTAAQLEAAIKAQAKAITAQTAGPTMQGCARTVMQKAAEVQGIGERLAQAKRK